MRWSLSLLTTVVVAACALGAPPNILVIVADDLGYGDVGCYGQKKIRTPHLDQLAHEGMRFTQAYAGSTVCAPSRCALLTGLHTGHCRVRGNGPYFLTADDVTIATVLKKAGYVTACFGKWGLGDPGTAGVPAKQGFDHFFGYLNHQHAHNYYPDHLWRQEEKVPLQNKQQGGVATQRVEYAPDRITAAALAFLDNNHTKPFFLYYTPTLPHANNEKTRADGNGNEVPNDEPYTHEDWPQPEKNKAAMITRLDADVGKLLAKLQERGLEKKTVVLFTSDNGPHKEGGNTIEFFASNGPLRGFKRSLTEGGIRVPAIVRWPGVVKPGSTSDHVWAFWDVFPTLCDIAQVPTPQGLDGISFLPTLTGHGEQRQHQFLYWEFHEGGTKQAVRHGNWKAIRLAPHAPLELYDLATDLGEKNNIAHRHPDVIATIENYLKTARSESKDWPLREPKKK
ncbi:MAG: arylsulfatase [Gemmataceae bacterium]|nr:arylsulfatase [Gemmata sp.]MDW8198828.1 arylsulfatase [Gemmataceae bacterium]